MSHYSIGSFYHLKYWDNGTMNHSTIFSISVLFLQSSDSAMVGLRFVAEEGTMKIYDFAQAPNPRKVRVYLAEKGIQVPLQTVDLGIPTHSLPGA